MTTPKIPLCSNTLPMSTAVDDLFRAANGPLRLVRDESTKVLHLRVRTWTQYASETLSTLTFGLLGKSGKQAEREAMLALNDVFSVVEHISQPREPSLCTLKNRLQLGILGISPDHSAGEVISQGVSCRRACPTKIVADQYIVDESNLLFTHEHGAWPGQYVVSQVDFRDQPTFEVAVDGKKMQVSYLSESSRDAVLYYEAAYLWQLRGRNMPMDKAVANNALTVVLEPQPDPQLRDRQAGRESRISEENAIGLVRAMRLYEKECREAGKPIGIVAACRDHLDFKEVSRRVKAPPATHSCY